VSQSNACVKFSFTYLVAFVSRLIHQSRPGWSPILPQSTVRDPIYAYFLLYFTIKSYIFTSFERDHTSTVLIFKDYSVYNIRSL